jgi:hypothetical protein
VQHLWHTHPAHTTPIVIKAVALLALRAATGIVAQLTVINTWESDMRISITIADLEHDELEQVAMALRKIWLDKIDFDIAMEEETYKLPVKEKKRKWSRKARLMAKQGLRKDGTPRKKRITKTKETV